MLNLQPVIKLDFKWRFNEMIAIHTYTVDDVYQLAL